MTPSASLFTVPEFTRTVSASPTNSIAASLESNQDEEHPKPSVKHSWSVLLPVITMTIMAWAVKTNARFREHASACCTGDFCGADAREIPDEIVIQNKPSEACSVVGNGTKDIELMPVSTFDDASVLGSEIGRRAENAAIRWPAQIRRTRWNCVPEDPVDEISLKGSSFYVSSDDEDDYKEPKTSFARMK